MLGGYGLRTVLRAELNRNGSADLTPVDTRALPSLDVVVAARDEEGVVTRLVERLTSLRYPADRLTTWVIDDGSQDRTPQLLDELAERHPSLQVIHRERDAGGANRGLSTQPWRSSLANGFWFSMPMPSFRTICWNAWFPMPSMVVGRRCSCARR